VPPDSDYRVDYVRFEIVDQDVTGLIVRTTKGASASGVIVLEGIEDRTVYENLRKERVYAYVVNQDVTRTSTQVGTINADGSFRIGGLRPGLLHFSIGGNRFQVMRVERAGMVQTQGIELREREQITGVRLIASYANGSVQGVVKLDGGPIPTNGRLYVSLKRLGEVPSPFSRSGEQAQVDARGQFIAQGLLPGTYEVTVAYAAEPRAPWRRATQQVVVTNGAVANVTLTIDSTTNPRRP
jgi:hypothetical protein